MDLADMYHKDHKVRLLHVGMTQLFEEKIHA